MTQDKHANRCSPDVRPGRLDAATIEKNFGDIRPPLSPAAALVEADRCYFCHDAPCTNACPTGIDVPAFIQKIRSHNLPGSAHTILRENILGGMCARVCPTEVLCEEACVRNGSEGGPVRIGLLQRYATDPVYEQGLPVFERAPETGKRVAVVGGGPAGLSAAHRLAMLGHAVEMFCRDAKLGGLNEYGIAAYKTVNDFAQREVDFILGIGGIDVRTGMSLGQDVSLAELQQRFDAVLLAVGLGDTNELGVPGEDLDGVQNAVDYIAQLRQAGDKSELPVGRRVVVIGGGMTAIDIAVQNRRLGAERVDIVYRRGPDQMSASGHEQELAKSEGIVLHHWARPVAFRGDNWLREVEFERTRQEADGRLSGTGETWTLDADVVFRAVGQTLSDDDGTSAGSMLRAGGKIRVDARRRTSIPGVWAAGDCVAGHDDLTVTAVQDGKLAAIDIDRWLRANEEDADPWQT
ncbi:MAG: NAD(P)-dependent oxidoreductase [Gammaproteobacteria bacterium]|nr:NAD(P)-dependent oxidoreductase [Gammaproteobacteria bacterium]MDH4254191.1 NAD(P)-dependent oxidoreductase [Gammaproteobacteria bacterium]MDH5309038.1 NAD(P)-dependent oxidoreductase [Gammaproteobacteria bacterium]